MIFMLSVDQAVAVCGVAKGASKDGHRPLLQQMEVSWKPDSEEEGNTVLTFVTTNSYLLVARTITTNLVDDLKGRRHGSALVPAKDFAKLVKDAAMAARKDVRPTQVGIGLDDEKKTIEVSTFPSEDFTAQLRMQMTPKENKFPQWESLFGERARTYEGGLPAFNPGYLRQLTDTISATTTGIDRLPATWFAAKGKSGELGAWGFRIEDKANATNYEAILMPVRL